MDSTSSVERSPRWVARSLWIGPALTALEWACLSSFVTHGAQFELFTDDLSRRVPTGVTLRSSQELLGRKTYRYGPRSGSHNGSLAMSADIARLRALQRFGGWWVDTDVLCLKSFAPIDSGFRVGWEDIDGEGGATESRVNVAVMRAVAGDPLVKLLLRRAMFPWLGSPWESSGTRLVNAVRRYQTVWDCGNIPWGWSCGPDALTQAVEFFGRSAELMPTAAFYPISWRDWRAALELDAADLVRMSERSYGIHLWSEMFRVNSVDRDRAVRSAAWAQPYLAGYEAR